MKPKHLKFVKRAFPAMIVVPAMLQMASAGTVTVGANGNLTVTSDYQTVAEPDLVDTNNTIVANGGTDPTYMVTVNTGAVLTGDAGLMAGVQILAANYTLTNAGSLSGANYGVDAYDDGTSTGFDVNVTNSGTIQGLAVDGIAANGGTSVISNTGTILGGMNGINFLTAGGTVTNSNSITGTSGSGILGISGLTLNNTGVLTGTTGVTVTGGGSTITVSGGGSITGTGGTAIQLGDSGNTVNLTNGTITGDINATGTGNGITAAGISSVTGDIAEFQTIMVNSSGVLEVEGNISGVSTIGIGANGMLRQYGDITGTDTVINAATGATLQGEGVWTTDINLASGASIYAKALNSGDPDIIEIAGDVTHAAGSNILVDIDPNSEITNDGYDHSLIRSTSGTYDATNATIDLATTGPEAIRNGDYVIVEGGTVLGGDNLVTYNGFTDSVLGNYFTSVALSGGDLVLTTEHNFSDLPGLTGNESVLGEVFDQFMMDESALPGGSTANQALRELIGDLDYNNLEYTQATLSGIIAPAEQVLGAAGTVVNTNYRLHRLAQDHLFGARQGGERTITTTTPATRDAKGGLIEGTTTTETVGSGKGNVWGTYSHDWQNFESTDHDGDVDALTVGFDYKVAPQLVLGLLIDGSKGTVNHAAGETDVESIRGAIYGTWGGSTGLYVDFLAGYGDHDLELTDATSLQGLATVGYTIESGTLKHGPFAGVEYQKVDVDGFSSDAVFPIEIDDFDVESFRGLLGYRINGSYGMFTPYLSVAYAHEFKDERYMTTATLAGYEFPIEGYEPGSAVLISAGTGVSLTDALSLNVGYRGEIALDDEGVQSHGGSVGLNYRF